MDSHNLDRRNFERVNRMLPIASDTLLQQRYRILDILGEGEYGRTYLATDRSRDDAYCAIEEITPSTQFPNTVARAKELFKQEATLLYQLDHSQLPRFWTTFEEQNRLFLVRDYIAGKTYGQLLDERRDRQTAFSQAEVWRFLLQMLPVLGSIHSKGAIHKNLAPEHIICRDGDLLPVPIDFGIIGEFAHKLQASPVSQPVGVGQPGYAPPEQLQSGQVYPNSDLYALAVTAIVLLTGKEPSALFTNGRMNWDWRQWTQLDDEFAQVLDRMLSNEPQARYQSAIEVYQSLQNLQIGSQPSEPQANRPSEMPTVVVAEKMPSTEAAATPQRTTTAAITALDRKSVWEKPQVFIPVGLLVALVVGTASFLGFRQIFQGREPEPVASTPPKQIDFNNPVISNDTNAPSETAGDVIQPVLDREVIKEGAVDATTPVRYRIAAVAGQNLNIQLVSPASQNSAATTDPASSISSPIAPISPTPTISPGSKSNNSTNPPIAIPGAAPLAATQVLMTILSPSGNEIDAQADRVVGWRGQIPTDGEYTIELRPIKGLAGNSFPYKLSVTQLASLPSATPRSEIDPIDGSNPTTNTTTPNPLDGSLPNPATTPSGSSTPNGAFPTITPAPIPIESASPNQNIRRSQIQTPSNSQTRQRTQVESTEQTPTPRRRRRRQVESNNNDEATTSTPRRRRTQVESTAEATPTPRRRRRRQANSQTPQPTPTNTPASENNSASTPQPEPSVGIPVPQPKTAGENNSPATGENNDTE